MYIIFFLLQDSYCANESQKDGISDSDLDLELESLRRKFESVSTLVVMIVIYLDFCKMCLCFLLFTRLTRNLKTLKESCPRWKGKLRSKEDLILLSLR